MDPQKPARMLTSDEVDAFHRDGAVRVQGVISDAWVSELSLAVDEVLAEPSVLARATAVMGGGGFSGDAFMWKAHETFHRFIFDSPAAHMAQQLLDSTTITAFYDQIFAKPAASSAATPYHEDMSSWPVTGDKICAFWIALDPCTPETAALQVVRGSHLGGKQFMPVTPAAGQLKGDYADATTFDDSELLRWGMQPGDVVMFHPRAVHGATGTGPEHGRRAFVSRWAGDDIRFNPRHALLPLLWQHDLLPGDPLGGPLFPQVLPAQAENAAFAPQAPDPELAAKLLSVLRFL